MLDSKTKIEPITGLGTKKRVEVGELRQDIITGKWIVIATSRSKKPTVFAADRPKPKALKKYIDDCPFCNLADYPQEPDILRLPDHPDKWQVHIFANKYPAFSPLDEFRSWQEGPYRVLQAVGYHELLATRWHNQSEANMSITELALELEALVLRYRQLKTKPSVNYIQIINNHGADAGGSLIHPHHQIFTVPVLPSDISDSLQGAERYAAAHGTEVFDDILKYERSAGERIIWENDHFTVFSPFASRVPFETWIMPRSPQPYFENMNPAAREALAETMRQIFRRFYIGLNDAPYNYFIHSAPCDDLGFVCDRSTFKNFRWHIEIMPRLTKFGGFELGTGLEINTAIPEECAAYLREVKIT